MLYEVITAFRIACGMQHTACFVVNAQACAVFLAIGWVEAVGGQLDQAQAGDNAGILLRGITRDDVERRNNFV